MKKWILPASLGLNVILLGSVGYLTVKKAPEFLVQEVTYDLHDHNGADDTISSNVSAPLRLEEQEAAVQTKMESARRLYLKDTLGLSNEDQLKLQKFRNDYFFAASRLWESKGTEGPTLENRRKLLDLEEELQWKVKNLLGESKWKSYQEFRATYNDEGFQRQIEENEPFIVMSL